MKHELEDQLKAFEKKGIDRRHFFKLMAMAGYGCPFKELAGQAGYHFDRSQ